MRITIDTELQAIIVPNSYYSQIDKMNNIIMAAGGMPLDYIDYIRNCFQTAMANKIITQSEAAALSPRRGKRSPYNKSRFAPDNKQEL